MSHRNDDDQPRYENKRLRRLVVGLLVLAVLLGGMLIYTVYHGLTETPAVGGGITLQAPAGAKVYVGDRLVGTGEVLLTWVQVLGTGRTPALGVELPWEGDAVPLEELAGPGATELRPVRASSGGSCAWYNAQMREFWLRRADGTVDQVFAIVARWTEPGQPPRRFVLPIRVRQGQGGAAVYFDPTGCSFGSGQIPTVFKALGKSPLALNNSWGFSRSHPPDFIKELTEKGLWEPGAGR